MTRRLKASASQAGFSLLEMMVVVGILVVVMGAVFQQVNTVQKRYKAEEQKLDLTQESREFLDQVIRDLHQAGYPNSKMFGAGILAATPANDLRNAVGLVRFAYDEIQFEGDVDGDGTVDSVDYRLVQDADGNCPCRVERSQVPKADATAPTAQLVSPNSELLDVVNSGGANGSGTDVAGYTIGGYTGTSPNNTVYAAYKTANVFTAYDALGNAVGPADFSTPAGRAVLKSIRTIKININVLGSQADMQTGMRPAITLAGSARIPGN
ncbi:MAG TPA: prepilin-type N-terminal cleavage/methylation domain-containing protein [Clostridia bacterium]|nr:prepilin-type N-terminal cleavage/methylation domain-containing protein [Clostridia bacterium]